MSIQKERAINFIEHDWEENIIPALSDYITIPCLSPEFDKDWERNGFIDEAMKQLETWVQNQGIRGLSCEILKLPGKTPVLFIEVDSSEKTSVFFYGHIDKQPQATGWDEGLHPFKAVRKGSKLYGRGSVDDGYALFCALSSIKALQDQGLSHPRCVIFIESCEESGSYDLPDYLEILKDRIGTPDIMICLDSGCGNYESLWLTTSLRGAVIGTLRVNILEKGVHSGEASGIIPSSFRIIRSLLSRLEDEKTGEILLKECHVEIPEDRQKQIKQTAEILGVGVYDHFPLVKGARPMSEDESILLLNETWKPILSITGVEGIPPLEQAGNVLRPFTSLKLSLRLPPTCDPVKAGVALKEILEQNAPYGARVQFDLELPLEGWNAPTFSSSFSDSVNEASKKYFGREVCYLGMGGSIGFMKLFAEKYPNAQFMVTGALGPQSNAHGPNEALDIPTAKKLTCCLTEIVGGFVKA
ncbi:peptidase M20 [Candidatus Uhrbacteria bacterium CG_4_9_14_3_um_filter_36_7]|uniref:Peptidase M20 n=1 Tax=Candidatus Uhrbacteria bacterium CG_4_9_14_3_um_filter_36_7 TaxID=1975033 RepID=A0A2M7XI53_9BACT|nr:MAG: peptidase M20 [Candidatus Uhrbacteria bacterium CG_4_9_14_3_um_filter_36_7]